MTKYFHEIASLSGLTHQAEATLTLPAAARSSSLDAAGSRREKEVADADRRPADRVRDDSPDSKCAAVAASVSAAEAAKSARPRDLLSEDDELKLDRKAFREAAVLQAPPLHDLERELRAIGSDLRARVRRHIALGIDIETGTFLLKREGFAAEEIRAYQHIYCDEWLASDGGVDLVCTERPFRSSVQ